MKRRVRGVDFARVWGEVKEWGGQDQADLVKLIQGLPVTRAEPKKREPRKAKAAAEVKP